MRIESLTFFRFVAATIVVIFHYGKDATGLHGILVAGPQMVTFFFVLSGFVMTVSYFNKNNIKAKAYWWARVSRIMPVYMLATILMVAIKVYSNQEVYFIPLLLNMTLLQSWFSPYPLSINSPGWSLSVEAFFYFSFPFILFFIKNYDLSVKNIFIFALSIWVVTQAIVSTALSNDFYDKNPLLFHDLIYYFPITHLCSFLLGISGGVWFIKRKSTRANKNNSLLLTIFSGLLVIFVINHESLIIEYLGFKVAFSSSFLAPLFLFFIISISTCQSKMIRILTIQPLVIMGEASFSLYILQAPVYVIYKRFISKFIGLSPLFDFYTFLAFLVLISILSFITFEKPANKFIRFSLPKLIKNFRSSA